MILLSSPVVRRLGIGWRRALQAENAEVRHARCAGHAFLTAHGLQAESLIEDVQIVLNRIAAERIDYRDRDALALVPTCQKGDVVVRVGHGGRDETAPAY